jgi:HK97 family phage major capsid protein
VSSLAELNTKLAEKSKLLHEVWAAAGEDRDFTKTFALLGVADTTAAAEKVRGLNEELTAIGVERDQAAKDASARAYADQVYRDSNLPASGLALPGAPGQRIENTKSIGRMFVESLEYQQFKGYRNWPTPMNLPNLDFFASVFRTGAGWAPEVVRQPGYVLSAQRPIAIVDMVPMLPTDQTSINFMEETTFTNNAAEKAESTATTAADLIGEAALVLSERTNPVEWLPVFIPVTIQQMEDVAGIEAYVDSRLQYMLRARLDSQILNGDGNTPNLKGTLNIGGSLQTQAKGTDPTPDAIYKLFTKLRTVGFAEPSVLFINPNDWQDIRLLRTADGVYIWGSPMEAGPERIWGVPVVQSMAVVENTGIAGDYTQFSALYTKRGISLAVSDSHSFYFTRGMLAIRADMRVSMVHRRTSAFGTVTGI